MTYTETALDRETMLGLPVTSAKTVEEDLFDLHSVFPESVEYLPELFRSAVRSSCRNLLGKKDSEKLLELLSETDLGDQSAVFTALDRHCPGGGSLVKSEITAEFHAKVRNLFRKAVRRQTDLDELLERGLSISKN